MQEKLKERGPEQPATLLSILDSALAGNLCEYHDYRALAYRLRGEILEATNSPDDARAAYKEALSLNPKIGVKRRLENLEKEYGGVKEEAPTKPRKRNSPVQNQPISASKVQELLYNFTQYAFIGGEIPSQPLDLKQFRKVIRILEGGSLTQTNVANQPVQVQRVLYELLTQYIMFVSVNPQLRYPPDFLTESSPTELGTAVTAYMVEHEWPFPQMLHQ